MTVNWSKPSFTREVTETGRGSEFGRWTLLLSHHLPNEYYRCLSLTIAGRRLWLCARCLGLYPSLMVFLGLQFILRPASGWWDWPWLFLPTLPFLLDWFAYRVVENKGNNFFRVTSGILLALALSRALYLHIIKPFHEKFFVWCLFLIGALLLVELIRISRT